MSCDIKSSSFLTIKINELSSNRNRYKPLTFFIILNTNKYTYLETTLDNLRLAQSLWTHSVLFDQPNIIIVSF